MKNKIPPIRLSCFAAFLTLLFLGAARGQDRPPQLPPVGTIDFYGLRCVSEKDVLSVLKIKAGDEAIETLEAVEENRRLLKSLPEVEDAAVSLVCCDDVAGKSIVFVGIRERGASVLTFRPAPQGSVRLTDAIARAGKDFQAAFARSLADKDFSEDDSDGNAFFGNKETRAAQKRFVRLAAENLPLLRRVLRDSSDAGERALAAQIIAYFSDKKAVVADLIYAAIDSHESVRNNAIRALIIIAKYARANPQLNIKIPGGDFVPMLDSLEWTDRNKSIGVLDELTKTGDAALLAELKKESLQPLAEMARWKNPGHAESAFRVLGRVADLSETEIEASWKSEEREKQVQEILRKIKKTPIENSMSRSSPANESSSQRRTVACFRRVTARMNMKDVIKLCGAPDKDIGSGIHIYVYDLVDGSAVRVGTPDDRRILYVVQVLANGEERSLFRNR